MKRLQLVAQVFANALARRRHELSLRESEERLTLAADSAEAGLWTLDYGTGVFWATERARAIFGYSPDEVVDLERLRGVGPSRRLGPRPGSHRAVRARAASPSTWSTGSSSPATAACGGSPPAARPHLDVRRRAGAPDGRLHRRHRAEARRRGASRGRGSPGGGRRPRRPRVLRGGLRRRHRLRRRPVSRHLRRSPGRRGRASRPLEFWMEHLHPDDRQRVLDAAPAAARREAGAALHRVSLPAPGPRGEVDSPRGPRRRARRRRTRGPDVRRPPRHHGAAAARGGAAAVATRRSSG